MYQKMPWKVAREMILEGFDVKTEYVNQFPYNVGLFLDGIHYNDCWNLIKSMIWAWATGKRLFKDRVNGTFFYDGRTYSGGLQSYDGIGMSGLPDVDGATLMAYCDGGGTSDFTTLIPMMHIFKPGHSALYVGEYELNGFTYNCVESNYLPGVGDGILPFWIDRNGLKYYCKGGSTTGARFTLCGKMSRWIDYSDDTEPEQPGEQHLNTGDLAAAIIRGYIGKTFIGTGGDRVTNLITMGYSTDEIRKAQDLVNLVYERQSYDKECADDAMRFISGEAGDGAAARKNWLQQKYGSDDRFRDIQDKVNAYLA